jgi:hypothetical protein
MVPSSVLTVATHSDRLTCGGTLSETIRLGSFKFIADYFSGFSLSPIGGVTQNPTSWRAMIEDSAEEFLIESSGEGGSDLPSPGEVARYSASSRCNHPLDGECSGHSGSDDGSIMDYGATAGYRPPFQAMTHLSGGAVSASPRLATHHRERGSTTMKQACRQTSRYHGPTARVAMA